MYPLIVAEVLVTFSSVRVPSVQIKVPRQMQVGLLLPARHTQQTLPPPPPTLPRG